MFASVCVPYALVTTATYFKAVKMEFQQNMDIKSADSISNMQNFGTFITSNKKTTTKKSGVFKKLIATCNWYGFSATVLYATCVMCEICNVKINILIRPVDSTYRGF